MELDKTYPPNPEKFKPIREVAWRRDKIEGLISNPDVDLALRERLFYLNLYVHNYYDFYNIWLAGSTRGKQKYGFIREAEYEDFVTAFMSLEGVPDFLDGLFSVVGKNPEAQKEIERQLIVKLNRALPKFRSNEDLMVAKSKVESWRKHAPRDLIEKLRRQAKEEAVFGNKS